MINLYVMNVSPFEDSLLFSKGLTLIDEERQDKVNKLKREDAKRLSLGAGLLLMFGLNYALEQDGNLEKTNLKSGAENEPVLVHFQAEDLVSHLQRTNNQKAFQYNYGEHGKPYIAGDKPIHFSLSHSGEYVFLAVSDREVGADIQQMKEVDFDKLAKHFMTEEELNRWQVETPEIKKELFYQLWAGKEAYLKLTGEGMTVGFQTVYYEENGQTMLDSRTPNHVIETFWGSMDDYQFAVCRAKA